MSPRLRHPLGAEHGRQSVLARLAGCLAVRDHMSAWSDRKRAPSRAAINSHPHVVEKINSSHP